MRQIYKMLDAYPGFMRSESQKRFHRCFVGACLPHIYGGPDFERFRERILADNEMDKVRATLLVNILCYWLSCPSPHWL